MKILCIKYFQHINKIISIMQPNLIQKPKTSRSQIKIENLQNQTSQQLLEKQLSTLKQNIQNLLKYCHTLENDLKAMKKSGKSSSQILQQNYYEISTQDFAYGQNVNSVTQSQGTNNKKHSQDQIIQKSKLELKKTRQLYLSSLNKIHQLKTQVSELTQKLNHFSQVHDTSDFNQTNNTSSQDLISSNSSLKNFQNTNSVLQQDQIDIENLLCYQDLDIQQPYYKQNNSYCSNKDSGMIQSLIAKGIQFRDQRTLRSNEFRHLSTIVQKYREQSHSNFQPMLMKKCKSISYR